MDLERPDDLREKATIAMAALFVLSLIIVVFLALTPQATTDPYTEFYLLGPDGNASDYPSNLSVGETGTLIVGVVNNEHQSTSYTVRLELQEDRVADRELTIEDGERWEEEFSITPRSEGRQRLWVRLYRGHTVGPSAEPLHELWLWIEVSA